MLLLVGAAKAEKYFVLSINHIGGSVTFNSINLREIGNTVGIKDKSGFLIKTVSFENSDLDVIHFNMSEDKSYAVYLPYHKNAARIEMYNIQNSKIMDIDVSSFSDTCGNNICEEHESYESCTKDCPSGGKDDFCDGLSDNICDPDCLQKSDADCSIGKEEKNETLVTPAIEKETKQTMPLKKVQDSSKYLLWISIAAAVIILMVLALLIKKLKENKIVNSLKRYIIDNIRRGFSLQQIKDALFREGYKEKEINNAIRSI